MNNIQHRRAVVAIKAGADGRGGLRFIDEDGVARFCVIGSMYSQEGWTAERLPILLSQLRHHV